MINALFVGLGGFIGSVLRYSVNLGVHRYLEQPLLPYGTILVNVLGCFLIGFMSGLDEVREVLTTQTHAFLIIGLFGGFTTFSTFGYEIFTMSRHSQFTTAFANLAIQLILGLAAVWLGHALARTA